MDIYLRPLIFLAAIPLLLIFAWLIRRFRFQNKSFADVFGATLLAFVVFFWFFLAGPFVGVTSYKTLPMTWSIGEQSVEASATVHGEANVMLTFVGNTQGVGYNSSELADYLRKSGKNPIDVIFEITSDYGKIRSFDVMKIDGLLLGIDARNPLASKPGDTTIKTAPAFAASGVSFEYLQSH